jgi:hypothetical protein
MLSLHAGGHWAIVLQLDELLDPFLGKGLFSFRSFDGR